MDVEDTSVVHVNIMCKETKLFLIFSTIILVEQLTTELNRKSNESEVEYIWRTAEWVDFT